MDMGRPVRIDEGPDNALQTVAAGDDEVRFDGSAFLFGSPFHSKGQSTAWRESHGVDVEWRFWDTPYLSWIGALLTSSSRIPQGGIVAIAGDFGIRGSGKILSLVNRTASYDLTIEGWTPRRITARIPLSVPPGNYRLLIYDDATRRLSSNSIRVDVAPSAGFLSVARGVNGGIRISWEGQATIESAKSPTGPWTSLGVNTSPYSASASSPQLFYRLVRPQ
jgi:hypothetical protein